MFLEKSASYLRGKKQTEKSWLNASYRHGCTTAHGQSCSHDPQRGAGWQEQADGAARNSDVTNNFPRIPGHSRLAMGPVHEQQKPPIPIPSEVQLVFTSSHSVPRSYVPYSPRYRTSPSFPSPCLSPTDNRHSDNEDGQQLVSWANRRIYAELLSFQDTYLLVTAIDCPATSKLVG